MSTTPTPNTSAYAVQPQRDPARALAAVNPGPPTNSLAVIALVVSIVGSLLFPLVGSVVGIVLGHQARKAIATSGEGGSGAATAAIVVGWAWIGLFALAVVIPTFLAVAGFVFAVIASS